MLKDIITPQREYLADGFSTVLRGHENRIRRVTLVKGNLVRNERSESKGVSARVNRDGRYGFASTAAYSAEDARSVLKAATENASFLHGHIGKGPFSYPALRQENLQTRLTIVDIEQKRYIDACKEVDSYIEKTYPDLTSRTVVYYEDTQDKIILSSDASSGHMVYPRCYIYVYLNAETKDGVPVEMFKAFGGRGSFEDNFTDLAGVFKGIDEMYNHLMKKKEGIFADAGVKTVILDGYMSGMLAHEAVGHTVEADLVTGGSVAGPCLNKRVGSDLVTMVDFANTAYGQILDIPVWLDDEGTVAEDALLIENGILKGYMHDRESAERFGMRPTGNARAWGFSDEPLIRMRNTAVLPGKDKLEDMIASIDDGYYLIDSSNGQADLTGEFMFGVALGYEIKNGKLGRALLDTTVSGIAFEMLKTVDMVSDEITWVSSGFCGKKQMIPVTMGGPALRCKIAIGGR
ncbi:MAG: TldD/PmbA family protein [Lachnospiraceae bacterium]|nr:TldD/PmbA family protein [Lachnospiraceae bacterium]